MSGSTTVSVLVPAGTSPEPESDLCKVIETYLETTGFTFEIIPLGTSSSYGASIRRGVAEASGRVVVIIDAPLPYAVTAIGDAVAMIESGATDIVFASSGDSKPDPLLRWMLVPLLPHPSLRLKAFSSTASRLAVGETRLNGIECDLEIAFLANKYGFRVEPLTVAAGRGGERLSLRESLVAATRIRLTNRNMGYRTPRRCPVCFSTEVWTCAQIPGNVVRSCSRCKCRYLNQFSDEEGSHPVRRVLRPHLPLSEAVEESHSDTARDKTSARRVAAMRKQLTSRARVLEVGVRDGGFGAAAAADYEYVGIDPVPTVTRHARARGLEVYCATLSNFVNTGPAFDGIALFHGLESMADPHDALARMKDLLKPGGLLFLTTFDTEGLLYLLTERKRMAQNFRTRLILYSRSALIELLENSGFEIEAIGPDFEYRDRKFLRHLVGSRWPLVAPILRAFIAILPDPLLVGTGSIRIIAKRRAGPSMNVRAIRSVEPTHAR